MDEDFPMEQESCFEVLSGPYKGAILVYFGPGKKEGHIIVREPSSEGDAIILNEIPIEGLEYTVLDITEKEALEKIIAEDPRFKITIHPQSKTPEAPKKNKKKPIKHIDCDIIYYPPLCSFDQIANGILRLGAEELNFLTSLPSVKDAVKAAIAYAVEPLAMIRSFNRQAVEESNLGRLTLDESLLQAVRLERSLDQIVFSLSPEKIYKGVPEYIPAGYKDLGQNPSLNSRDYREMFLVTKDESLMLEAKKIGLQQDVALETKIKQLSKLMHVYLEYGEAEVIRERNGETVSDKTIMGTGKGVCRHTAIILQTLCQTAGIKSYTIKSNSHAYNLVVDEEQNKVYFVDATPSSKGEPTDIQDMTDEFNIGKDLPGVLRKGYRKDHLRTIIRESMLGRIYKYRPRDIETTPSYCLFVDVKKKK